MNRKELNLISNYVFEIESLCKIDEEMLDAGIEVTDDVLIESIYDYCDYIGRLKAMDRLLRFDKLKNKELIAYIYKTFQYVRTMKSRLINILAQSEQSEPT